MAPKILIVDDEEDIRGLVEFWLKSAGYDVATAEDGASCLEKIKAVKFDLILLDVMMPGMKPSQVLQGIRDCSKGTKVLYLTAVEWLRETEDQRSRGFMPVMEAPVVGYILKPADKENILSKVKEVLTR